MDRVMNIAKYTVDRCMKKYRPITNLKLQKILYFIQLQFMKKGFDAFSDHMYAWKFGPVAVDVYKEFSICGSRPIIRDYNDDDLQLDMSENKKDFLDRIIDKYSQINSWELTKGTHLQGSPWDIVYQDGKGKYSLISSLLIAEYLPLPS